MYGYAIQQGLLRNDYQNLQKYMNIAFIGRYLPKMLETPLNKGVSEENGRYLVFWTFLSSSIIF